MEINLGDEHIVVLQAAYSDEQIREKALAKRVDVFGRVTKLLQRLKPEDIEITTFQKRFEPFWFVAASARYVYDRRHKYHVEVTPEVQAVTVHGNKYAVMCGRNSAFELEAVEHCTEEVKRELILDAMQGNEADFGKYLNYPKSIVPDMAAFNKEGTIVVLPEIRGSFVVRKMILQLIRMLQADAVHEENIELKEVTLFYRPLYAVEYFWKAKNKKLVVEFDALTGEAKSEGGVIMRQVTNALDKNTLFDFGADAAGVLIPGASFAIKWGRIAVKKAMQQK